jgi:hypothetical protein
MYAGRGKGLNRDQRWNMLSTRDSSILEADDLQPNAFSLIGEAEARRQRCDILYRLLTSADVSELNQHVLGLISDGSNGMQAGLLFRKYGEHMNRELRGVLQALQERIVESELKCNEGAHRAVCHMLLFAALALESEFVNYIVLYTHDRQRLARFRDGVLRDTMHKMLSGMLIHPSKSLLVNNVRMFTQKLYSMYMMACTP